MIALSKGSLELLKDLMERFIDEVERGAHPLKAGWMKTRNPETNTLKKLNLAEKGEKGTRLVLDRNLRKKVGDVSDKNAEEFIDICIDIAKAVEVEKLVTEAKSGLLNDSQLQAVIVVLGWWRMLETSEFPVAVDEVLKGGLSPDKWYVEAPRTSQNLALSVANKWWRIDLEKVRESLNMLSIPMPGLPKVEVIDEVRRILRWNEVLEAISEEESKDLAFLWFADYLSMCKGVCYPEAMTFVQSAIWETLEKSRGKKRLEIIEQVERMLEKMPFQKLNPPKISWVEIIRFPW